MVHAKSTYRYCLYGRILRNVTSLDVGVGGNILKHREKMKKYYYLMDISQALIKPRTSATLHFNSVTFVCIPPLVHIDAHIKRI